MACLFHRSIFSGALGEPAPSLVTDEAPAVPVFRRRGNGTAEDISSWNITWEAYPARPSRNYEHMDELTRTRLEQLKPGRETLELGFSLFSPVLERGMDRPIHPPIVLGVEKRSGAVLGFVLGGPDTQLAPLLFEVLAKAAEALGARPKTIEVRDRLAEEALQKDCARLGIRLLLKDALPEVEEAIDSLMGAAGGSLPGR